MARSHRNSGVSTPPPVSALPDLEAVSIETAATVLGVGEKTVRRWIDEGLLPVVKIGHVLRILVSDLRVFIETHRENGMIGSVDEQAGE